MFDAIAKRRRVFKVETIGDCYVGKELACLSTALYVLFSLRLTLAIFPPLISKAVTGIPQPQEDHAIIMVRFARECMSRLASETAHLAERLGEDTLELGMRAGLHSGPTTAGVLRGERSRFQLFGDTVNTASRMESNGVKGCIHISQNTADELIAKGKGHWLTPREERIFVKGKGEMQTFFVTVSGGAGSVVHDHGSKNGDTDVDTDCDKESMENGLNYDTVGFDAIETGKSDQEHLDWLDAKLEKRMEKCFGFSST